MIELDGSGTGQFADGLDIRASNTVVRGLVVNRFADDGIQVFGASARGVRVEGNFVGTDPSGTIDLGNGFVGVAVIEAADTVVGGSASAARNLVSGNGAHGVGAFGSSNVTVQGNLVGSDRDGTNFLGNFLSGVFLRSDDNTVGGSTAGSANVIGFNGEDGVLIEDGTGNRVLRNSIFFSLAGLAIDLGRDGLTANDPGDADTGANDLQNKPAIASARTSVEKATIRGALRSKPNQTFMVRFFLNPRNQDEGRTFIGKKKVTTGSDGKASFIFSPARKVGVGKTVTATATGPEGTSEFSTPEIVAAR